MSLVDTEWLEKNLDKTKIIDCSWHMSQTNRNGFEEYKKQHIKNAIFFDLDKNSKKNTDLPHMLTDIKSWENIVSDMGIKNNDEIVIYDNSDVISSCRCWYNFIYFGHDPKLVHVLDGGLKKWNTEKKQTNQEITQIKKTQYKAIEFKNLVKSKNQIDENINLAKFRIIDARSKERFEGKEVEPRKNVRSGSIKNSLCLPFKNCINKNSNEFLKKSILSSKFKSIITDINDKNIVFTCGSGVTATVLAFAYSLINKNYLPIIYDGSWSEYGKDPT